MRINLSLFFSFFLIFIPVFIGYDLDEGFVTDISIFSEKLFAFPSFPIGIIISLIGFALTMREQTLIRFVAFNLFFGLLSILIFTYTESIRHFAYNLSILIATTAFYLGKYFNEESLLEKNIYILSFVVIFIIYSKLLVDIIYYETLFSDYFIFKNFIIYNLYDYFPIIYLISGALSLLLIRTNYILGFFAFLGSFLAFFTWSRFYAAAVLSLYLFSLLRIHKVKPYQSSIIALIFVVILTAIVPFFAESFNFDESLSLRVYHWQNFFTSTDLIGLVFPFINDYRSVNLSGTFHNEFLDPYSYFGIFYFFILFAVIMKINNLDYEVRYALVPFFIILIFGMIIQNNFSQPYNALVVFFLMGLFTQRKLTT